MNSKEVIRALITLIDKTISTEDHMGQTVEESLIYEAIKSGNLEIFNILVEVYYEEYSENTRENLMKFAVKSGHLNIVNRFIELGVNIHGMCGNIIYEAAECGNFEILMHLINKCSEMPPSDLYLSVDAIINNAFLTAVSCSHFELAKKLLEKGADINYDEGELIELTAEDYDSDCIVYNNHIEVIQFMVDNGARVTDELINQITNSEIQDILKQSRRRNVKPAAIERYHPKPAKIER
jgi:ankyrin repeat protein